MERLEEEEETINASMLDIRLEGHFGDTLTCACVHLLHSNT